MFDLLVSPFFDSQGGQIKVRFGGTLRVRPTPSNFSFKIDYQAETHYLHGGRAIVHSNTSPLKRIFLSTLRALRRVLWFSDAYRIIKEQHIDAVIIPSATTHDSRDSIAASTAIVNAFETEALMVLNLIAGI